MKKSKFTDSQIPPMLVVMPNAPVLARKYVGVAFALLAKGMTTKHDALAALARGSNVNTPDRRPLLSK